MYASSTHRKKTINKCAMSLSVKVGGDRTLAQLNHVTQKAGRTEVMSSLLRPWADLARCLHIYTDKRFPIERSEPLIGAISFFPDGWWFVPHSCVATTSYTEEDTISRGAAPRCGRIRVTRHVHVPSALYRDMPCRSRDVVTSLSHAWLRW